MRTGNNRKEPSGKAHTPVRLSFLRFAPLGIILAGFLIACAMGWQHSLSLENLLLRQRAMNGEIASHPFLAPTVFFLLYAIAITLSLPGMTLLTLLSGALFGWALGGAVVVCAATAGGIAVFLCARTALGGIWRSRHEGKFSRFAEGLRENAFSYILILRLAPMFPFFVINIGSGLIDIRLRTFAAATFLGIIPETFVLAWLGRGIDSIVAAAHAAGRPLFLTDLLSPEIAAGLGLLMLAAAIPLLAKLVRNHLKGRGSGKRPAFQGVGGGSEKN